MAKSFETLELQRVTSLAASAYWDHDNHNREREPEHSGAFMSFLFSPGSLHEGDEIAEINGKSVANHTVDQLQKILVSSSFLA